MEPMFKGKYIFIQGPFSMAILVLESVTRPEALRIDTPPNTSILKPKIRGLGRCLSFSCLGAFSGSILVPGDSTIERF